MSSASWTSPLPDPGQLRDRIARALDEVAGICLEDADRTIPHERGDLQDSGHTTVDRASLTSTVAYGTPYAIVQHEDATLRHKDGRRDHWLERTVYENTDRYAEHIAKAIER